MKRIAIVLLIIILFLTGFVYVFKITWKNKKPYYDGHLEKFKTGLTKEKRFQRDFKFLYKEIKNNYVNLAYKEKKYNFDWDELYKKYKREVKQARNEKAFYKICRKFLTKLHDGHLSFNFNNRKLRRKVINHYDYITFPFNIRLIEGKYVVVRSFKKYDILGEEVISINGIDFNKIVERMTKYYDYRGNNKSAKAVIVQRDLYFNYFDFFPNNRMTYNNYPVLRVKLKNKQEKTHVIQLKNQKYSMQPIKRISGINFGFYKRRELPSYEILHNNIGYILIPTFGADKKEIINRFRDIVLELKKKKVKGVILDVRYNGGGNSSFRKILGFLTDEKIYINNYRFKKTDRFRQVTIPFRTLYERIRSKEVAKEPKAEYTKWWKWSVTPNEENFLRTIPIVVLVNESIFSSTGGFVNTCLNFDLATVVGNIAPMSGHGLAKGVLLPSRNYYIRYPFFEERDVDFSHLENVVKQPDIKIKQTLDDFYQGIDTQLKKGIKYIQRENGR